MRRPKAGGAVPAMTAIVVASTLLTGCAGDGYQESSTDVERAAPTEVSVGSVEVVLPAGASTGGTLVVREGPEPADVPEGVVALGPSATVSLGEGTLDEPMQVAFEPPPVLSADHVPIVMAEDDSGDWQWLPTSWDGKQRITADLPRPGQVFLARFDRTPSLEEATTDFVHKANNAVDAPAPGCGDVQAAVEAGLQVSSEPQELLQWCAGVDTIAASPGVPSVDVDYSTEGLQGTVLRLLNSSRLVKEVGYPEDWAAVDGSGRGLPGQELRERLGLAGTTRAGLATRVLWPGETLTLLLPGEGAEAAGTVTADLSAAAWALSVTDFAASTYGRLVTGVDKELGDGVWAARRELLAELAGTRSAGLPDHESTVREELRDCLTPAAEVVLMDRGAAEQLVEQLFSCVPELLRPAVGEGNGGEAGVMADAIATSVLAGLPSALEVQQAPWAQVSDAVSDPQAGIQLWVGPPPAQEYDYAGAPHVLAPGEQVAVAEWSAEFSAYVEERLDLLVATAGPDPDAGAAVCPQGSLSVTRYRTDGFALAEQVGCDGEPWTLVLGRTADGWQEIDQIQQDPHFGCSVLGTYSVPAFIAGTTCLDGEQPQEYPR